MKTVVLALTTIAYCVTSAFGQHKPPNQLTAPAKSEDARPAAPPASPMPDQSKAPSQKTNRRIRRTLQVQAAPGCQRMTLCPNRDPVNEVDALHATPFQRPIWTLLAIAPVKARANCAANHH